jgi:predicted molibdopterin-dependent oxidoreductase YjgC
MGVCFECLVTIDGRSGRQACITSVRQGMKVSIAGEMNHYG